MSAQGEAQTVPSEAELSTIVTSLKASHPDLGIAKLLAQLKLDHPTLSVSEKRLRKVLSQTNGGAPNASQGGTDGSAEPGKQDLVAQTGLDSTIDWSVAPKIKVKMFKGGKGKGLVAREKVEEGEVLWSEDPWIVTASPQLREYLHGGGMCSACLNLFTSPPKLAVHCQHCGQATFCSRLCYGRREEPAAAHLDLLCPGQNNACAPLWSLIHKSGWRDLECVAKIVARWRTLRESGDVAGADKVEERVWRGMARVNQVTKEKERKEWPMVGEQRLGELHRAHTLLLAALNPPEADKSPETKSFYKVLRKRRKNPQPMTEEQEARWFSFDSFCDLLGLAGLNQEDSGGLYAIHAHMNHDCEPNIRVMGEDRPIADSAVQVRNLPKDFVVPNPPSDLASRPIEQRGTNRLTFVARRTIHPGEELTLPYVNYGLPRSARRERLRGQYGFWCHCTKCRRQEGMPEDEQGGDMNDEEHDHSHAHQHGPNCHHD